MTVVSAIVSTIVQPVISPVVVSSGAAPPAPDSLLTDLVAWWSLDEASGTRVNAHNPGVYDLTDNNTVGSTTGVAGNCAEFVVNSAEYLSLAHHADFVLGDRDFTAAGWFLVTASSEENCPIISKGVVSGTATGWQIYHVSGVARFRARRSDNTASTTLSSAAAADDVWHFVLAQYTATSDEMSIKLNGDAAVTGTLTGGGVASETNTLYLGNDTATGREMDGKIDEVAVWHRLLTTDEKNRLYNSGAGMAYPG